MKGLERLKIFWLLADQVQQEILWWQYTNLITFFKEFHVFHNTSQGHIILLTLFMVSTTRQYWKSPYLLF